MENSIINNINSDEEMGDLENTEWHFSCNPGETWDGFANKRNQR